MDAAAGVRGGEASVVGCTIGDEVREFEFVSAGGGAARGENTGVVEFAVAGGDVNPVDNADAETGGDTVDGAVVEITVAAELVPTNVVPLVFADGLVLTACCCKFANDGFLDGTRLPPDGFRSLGPINLPANPVLERTGNGLDPDPPTTLEVLLPVPVPVPVTGRGVVERNGEPTTLELDVRLCLRRRGED
jgi:hypothetical protein